MNPDKVMHIYIRVSSEVQIDNFSLGTQKEHGIAKAKSLGMSHKIWEDAGKSAKNDDLDNRPAMRGLLDEVSKGNVKHVFVIELSRLSRNDITQAMIKKKFYEHHVKIYAKDNVYDLNSPDQDFMMSIISAVAKFENAQKSERSIRGKLASAKAGRVAGGIQAFGYKKGGDGKIVIDEEEAKTYKLMVELSLKGWGTRKIADHLNELGLPTKASKAYHKGIRLTDKHTKAIKFKPKERFTWKDGTVLGILKNTMYKGVRRYKGLELSCPAIIDADTWQQVQNNFINNKNVAKRNNNVNFYLLKGLIQCNKCKRSFYGFIKESNNMNVYVCMSKRAHEFCGCKSINITKLDDIVWNAVKQSFLLNFSTGKYIESIIGKSEVDINALHKGIEYCNTQIEELNKQRKNIIRLAVKGLISEDDVKEQTAEVESSKIEFTNRILDIENQIELSQVKTQVQDGWSEHVNYVFAELGKFNKSAEDPQYKRAVILEFVDRIIIDYNEGQHTIQVNIKVPLKALPQSQTIVLGAKKQRSIACNVPRYADNFLSIEIPSIVPEHQIRRSSAAARSRVPARSRSRTTACSSSTSCRSSRATCSR